MILPAGGSRQQLYLLALVCAQDARARGYQRGRFRLQDGRLLALLQLDFKIDAHACGWEPNTGRPLEWEVEVELDDAIDQLKRLM